MIRTLAPHPNTDPPRITRALAVYRAFDKPPFPPKTWFECRRCHAHHHANPRSLPYMLELLLAFRNAHCPEARIDLFVEGADAPDQQAYPWLGEILTKTAWEQIQSSAYDTALLLYPDPLGTGFEPIETRVAAMRPQNTLILNGRRRVFYWDRAARGTLGWRRFLARNNWLEIAFVPPLLAVGSFFRIMDLFQPDTGDQSHAS